MIDEIVIPHKTFTMKMEYVDKDWCEDWNEVIDRPEKLTKVGICIIVNKSRLNYVYEKEKEKEEKDKVNSDEFIENIVKYTIDTINSVVVKRFSYLDLFDLEKYEFVYHVYYITQLGDKKPDEAPPLFEPDILSLLMNPTLCGLPRDKLSEISRPKNQNKRLYSFWIALDPLSEGSPLTNIYNLPDGKKIPGITIYQKNIIMDINNEIPELIHKYALKDSERFAEYLDLISANTNVFKEEIIERSRYLAVPENVKTNLMKIKEENLFHVIIHELCHFLDASATKYNEKLEFFFSPDKMLCKYLVINENRVAYRLLSSSVATFPRIIFFEDLSFFGTFADRCFDMEDIRYEKFIGLYLKYSLNSSSIEDAVKKHKRSEDDIINEINKLYVTLDSVRSLFDPYKIFADFLKDIFLCEEWEKIPV